MMKPPERIILFDGVCNFCNASVNFIIDRDPESLFPDITAAVSSADYLGGRDPAMEAVAIRLGLPRVASAP